MPIQNPLPVPSLLPGAFSQRIQRSPTENPRVAPSVRSGLDRLGIRFTVEQVPADVLDDTVGQKVPVNATRQGGLLVSTISPDVNENRGADSLDAHSTTHKQPDLGRGDVIVDQLLDDDDVASAGNAEKKRRMMSDESSQTTRARPRRPTDDGKECRARARTPRRRTRPSRRSDNRIDRE
jgi:hypothetical protein